MSTYHYLACEDHHVLGPMLAADKLGGWTPGQPVEDLVAFRSAHPSCAVRVIHEHESGFERFERTQPESKLREALGPDA